MPTLCWHYFDASWHIYAALAALNWNDRRATVGCLIGGSLPNQEAHTHTVTHLQSITQLICLSACLAAIAELVASPAFICIFCVRLLLAANSLQLAICSTFPRSTSMLPPATSLRLEYPMYSYISPYWIYLPLHILLNSCAMFICCCLCLQLSSSLFNCSLPQPHRQSAPLH